MGRSAKFNILLILGLIPATLYLGTILPGRWYYLTSTLMVVETMIPFFLAFETRKPQARELVTIAVMCALAVASRVVMVVPNFKPTTAIIMLAGIALGPEAGFMTGAVSAFASNFFYSQGPWTPWQMMAYGMGGFLAGIVFRKWIPTRKPIVLAIFGYLCIQFLVGPLLDTCTIFTVSSRISWKFAKAVYLSGAPMNFVHAMSCAATMLLMGKPLLYKLDRLKRKYGIMDIQMDN